MEPRKNSSMMPDKQVNIRLTKEQKDALERVANDRGKNVSEFLRELALIEIGKHLAVRA